MVKGNFKGLRTTIYKVQDLNKAKEWYTKAFGVSPYFDEPFYVGFNVAGYELGLQPSDALAKKGTANVVSYWASDNVSADFNRLIDLGAEGHEAPKNVGGELIVATVIDPWNNAIGLIYNPYFKIE